MSSFKWNGGYASRKKKSRDESDIEKYKFHDNKNRTETLKDWVLVMDTWKAADI